VAQVTVCSDIKVSYWLNSKYNLTL